MFSALAKRILSSQSDISKAGDEISLHLASVNAEVSPDGTENVERKKKGVTYPDTEHVRVQDSLTHATKMTTYCL